MLQASVLLLAVLISWAAGDHPPSPAPVTSSINGTWVDHPHAMPADGAQEASTAFHVRAAGMSLVFVPEANGEQCAGLALVLAGMDEQCTPTLAQTCAWCQQQAVPECSVQALQQG